jgi:hypothetical protein
VEFVSGGSIKSLLRKFGCLSEPTVKASSCLALFGADLARVRTSLPPPPTRMHQRVMVAQEARSRSRHLGAAAARRRSSSPW